MVILPQFLQMKKLRQREIRGLAEDHMAGRQPVLGSLILTFHALSGTLTYRCFSVTRSTTELPSLTVPFPSLLPNIPAATEGGPFVHCAALVGERVWRRIEFPFCICLLETGAPWDANEQ